MPLLGTPVICSASGVRQEALMTQYTASFPAANAGLIDLLVTPSAGKSLRLAGLGFVAGAALVLRLAGLSPVNLPVTVNTTTDAFNSTVPHGLRTGDVVVLGGTTAPAGAALNTPYHARRLNDNDFELYTTAVQTVASGTTGRLDLTTTGTAVTLSHRGVLVMRPSLTTGSGYSHDAKLAGDFIFQLEPDAILAVWADVELPFMRFTTYEV